MIQLFVLSFALNYKPKQPPTMFPPPLVIWAMKIKSNN